jgi:hypothetical protein
MDVHPLDVDADVAPQLKQISEMLGTHFLAIDLNGIAEAPGL